MRATQKKILFTSLFVLIGFIALQIPFTKLAGSNVSFTLFDFFGPIAGAFLGPVFGIISVLSVQLFNFAAKGYSIETASIIRLFPMLFAVFYFAVMTKKEGKGRPQVRNFQQRLILFVPVFSMFAFWAHPVGREVWYYALFWTIPLIAYFKRDLLFARSLGATFTAHSVGGAAWIWAFSLPAVVWKGLIPVVISERILFAFGIAGTYLLMRYVLKFLISRRILPNLEIPGFSIK